MSYAPSGSLVPTSTPTDAPSVSPSISLAPSVFPTEQCDDFLLLVGTFNAITPATQPYVQDFASTCDNGKSFPFGPGTGPSFPFYSRYTAFAAPPPPPLPQCIRVFLKLPLVDQMCTTAPYVMAAYLKDSFDPLNVASGVGYLGDSGVIDDVMGVFTNSEFSFILPAGAEYDLVVFRTTDALPGEDDCFPPQLNILYDNQCENVRYLPALN